MKVKNIQKRTAVAEMTARERHDETLENNFEMRQLVELAESEQRELTKEENDIFEALVKRTEALRSADSTGRTKVVVGKDRSRDSEVKTPLLRAFREVVNGVLSEETQKLFDAGKEEMRRSGVAVQKGFSIESRALTAGVNSEVVATEKKRILDPLRNELVFTKLGANVMTGLVGDIEFPKYSGTSSFWKGEIDKAQDGKGSFDLVKYSPKRLTSLLDVSMQFLIQDSVQAEQMLQRDLIRSIQEKLEATAFGTTTGGDAPTGLFHDEVQFPNVASFEDLVKIVATVKSNNALNGSLGFVTNPMGEAKLLTTPINETGTYGFLANGDKVLSHNYAVSSGVADVGETDTQHGLVFANWQDFIVANWGGINFVVDNVSKADTGIVRFIINSFWDFGFRRDESFVTGSIVPMI